MQEKRSFQDTIDAIYSTVCRAEKPLTQLEIARAINRKKAPALVGIINRLADEGWLTRSSTVGLNGHEVFVYTVGRRC